MSLAVFPKSWPIALCPVRMLRILPPACIKEHVVESVVLFTPVSMTSMGTVISAVTSLGAESMVVHRLVLLEYFIWQASVGTILKVILVFPASIKRFSMV